MLLHKALRIKPGEIVTLTGAGGKTTLMFRLADEIVEAGHMVATTMTTKIFIGQMNAAPAHLFYADEAQLLSELPAALVRHRHVLLAGNTLAEEGKVQGLPPEVIATLAALPQVDAVLVEGDGSRRLPVKAPAAHEPVVPASSTILVNVVGLDAAGRPLTGDFVHRAELVAALCGVQPGVTVTPEMIARVVAHPLGGAKGLPPGARFVPVLNKADLPGGLAAGRTIARRLLSAPVVDSVLIAAAETSEPVREVWVHVGAIVLAAGRAERFGSLKQVNPWQGLPLVAHVASQALRCSDISDVVVAVGAEAMVVETAARQAGEVRVINVPDWAAGQSRSVRAGLAALSSRCSAALFLLADQPSVTPELLTALIERHRETLAPVVAPRYQGRRGNPVLFDAVTFAEFAELEGDIGARPIIRRHQDEIAWVDWPSPSILNDIDTPADYDAAL